MPPERAGRTRRRPALVTGAITTVILPGPGRCVPRVFWSRFRHGGLPIDGREIYTFSMTGPDSELSWDIARAQELLSTAPTQAKEARPG